MEMGYSHIKCYWILVIERKHRMSKEVRIVRVEVKKILKNYIFYAGIILAVLAAFLVGREGYYSPESFGIKHVISFYGLISNFIIYYFSAKMLGEDFDLKTSTIIFSGIKSRKEVYVTKIVSFLCMGAVLGIVAAGVSVIGNIFLEQHYDIFLVLKEIGRYGGFYLVYCFVVGSTALLVTTLFQKMVTSLSIVIVCYSVLPEIIGMVQEKIPALRDYTKLIPFYGGWLSLNSTVIEIQIIIGMIVFGFLFFILSIYIADKQDFK